MCVHMIMCRTNNIIHSSICTLQVIVNGANVVWVVILSVFLVKTRYKLVHYVAMLISTVGMVVLIIEDLKSKSDNNSGG